MALPDSKPVLPAISSQSPGRTTVEIIRDPARWDALRPQWEDLVASSPTAAPPLRFDWLRVWWEIYGPAYAASDGLYIPAVWRDDRLIGALPLYERCPAIPMAGVRRLCFISQGEQEFEEICPDYMDMLHRPGERETCLAAIREALLEGEAPAWDQLELGDISAQSPLLQGGWNNCRAVVASRGVCPAADITGGLEAYFQHQSANSRQQMRRLLRSAGKAGATLRLANGPTETRNFFDDMVELHQARWAAAGQPGVFGALRFAAFHRAITERWTPDGRAVLARLAIADRPLAVIYGFTMESKFHFYQSGVAIESVEPMKSPGIVAFLLLMDQLAGQGITEFDFLRGSSEYKQRLATHEHAVMNLTVVRPTMRSYVHYVGAFLRQTAARGYRSIKGA